MSLLTLVVLAPPVWADSEVLSAAERDWTPWDELPPMLQARTPQFCGGNYVAPDPDPAQAADDSLRVSSREARYRQDDALVLEGDVSVRQRRFLATADQARYDQSSGQVLLQGDVTSRGEGFLLTSREAEYNTESQDMRMATATFLLHDAHMRGTARALERTGPEQLRISGGTMTTCAPDSNHWSIAAGQVDLDQESGFGTARHARVRVKDVPVFYVPWMSFPIDDRRKSGFLYPSFGTANTGSGFFLAAPYYFNLAPHYDATYTPQIIHGRGVFHELEGRYLSRWGQSDLGLGFIDRDSDFADEAPDENSQRWGLSFVNRSRFGDHWRGDVDYSVVSDDDYLSDLNQTLDIQQTTHLPRNARLRYSRNNLDFSGRVRGFQTLDPDIADADRPYFELPALDLSYRQRQGPFRGRGDAQYRYFWRDNDDLSGIDAAIGNRLRLRPQVGLGWEGLSGFARTSVLLDHTEYALEDVPDEDRFSRTVPFYDVDAGLYFDRDLSLFGHGYRQTLEPRLYYVYSPFRDQTDVPNFDTAVTSFYFDQLFARDRFTGGDRIGDNNRLSTALTTRFHDTASGLERARFSLGQIYRFDDEEVGLADGRGVTEDRSSALAGEVGLQPLDNLSARVSGQWDPDEERTLLGRSQLRYHSDDFRYLFSIGHTYDAQDILEQTDVGAVVPLGQQTSLIGRWVYDLALEETAGSLVGIEYTSCCWNIQLVAQSFRTRDDGLDHRILFQVQLRGLGAGGGAQDAVAKAIPGFGQREPWDNRGPGRHDRGRLGL